MQKYIYRQVKGLRESIKRSNKKYASPTFFQIIFPILNVILIGITALILHDTLEIQNQMLQSQNYFNEIETRPYLNLRIRDVHFKDMNASEEEIIFTIEFINNGNVPARNIIVADKLSNHNLEEERNWDIISGSKVGMTLHLAGTKPFTSTNFYIIVEYDGMKEDKKRYKTLIAGKIVKKQDVGYFDPIAIKLDDAAMAWQFAFEQINKGKKDNEIAWPKYRRTLN